MPPSPELLAAYESTSFTARTPGGELVIRIGRRHPEVDRLLAAAGAGCWAYVTAWNPGSQRLCAMGNLRRQEKLLAELSGRYELLHGAGVSADGGWSEPSLLVLGMSRAEAMRIGRAHGQNAVVVGEAGGKAELVWCGEV